MENKKVLAKLEMRTNWTPAYIILSVVWWIAEAIAFKITSYTTENRWESRIYKHIWGIAWSVECYDPSDPQENETWGVVLILGILITIVIFLIPIFIKLFMGFIAKRCSLVLEEEQIVGQLKLPFSTKRLQMPIEKMDNVLTSDGVGDKFRGGETVIIHSNSGAVKFHYVRNAGEFSSAALKQIEKYKKNVSSPSAKPSDKSLTDKLKELSELKNSGLITDEEFEKKKQELMTSFN